MPKVILDSCEYEAPQEVINAYNKLRTDAGALESKVQSLVKDNDTLKGENAAIKSKVDSFEKRDLSKEIADAVKSRRSLESVAAPVLAKEVVAKFDSMTDAEIKAAVITIQSPDIKLDGQSEAFIDGCFTIAVTAGKAQKRVDAAANNRMKSKDLESGKEKLDSKKINSKSSHELYLDSLENGWKKKPKK